MRPLASPYVGLVLCLSLSACAGVHRSPTRSADPVAPIDAVDAVDAVDAPGTSDATTSQDDTADSDRGEADAARRFVGVLEQLPGFAPASTTLTFEQRALRVDPFLKAFEAAARDRGYGARVTAAVGVVNAVSHESLPVDDRSLVRTVSVGEVQMRRRFERGGDGVWRPRGSLFVRGADTSGVRLAAVPAPAPAVAEVGELAASIAANGASSVDAQASPGSVAGQAPASLAAVDRDERRNVAELGASNFVGLFENTTDVETLTLVFANDSMNLGPSNKRRIETLLERVDPERDLFSIVGCSFGRTAIANGNEVLATGRANRVREELLFAGVASDRVLDEGCWAGAPESDFPTRGVVLTVKRRPSG